MARSFCAGSYPQRPNTGPIAPPVTPPRATGATAGTPGTFTPGGSATPVNFADLTGAPPITASPASAWTVGQHVILGDVSHAYWTGSAYAVGDAPAAPIPATGATAGTPGTFTPPGCVTPANLAAMTGITASPATAWTVGQHVILADASHCYWNASAWVAGDAPAAGGGFPAATYGTVLGEYDFSNAASITATGGLVSSVTAISGTWGAIGNSGTSRPTTGTRTQNAKNVLDFDGTDDYLYRSGGVTQSHPLTIAFACSSDNTDSTLHELTGYQPDLYVEADVWKMKSPTVVASAVAEDSGFHIVVGIFNGASSEMWFDGVKVLGPVNVGSTGFATDFYVGCGLSLYWNGRIGHAITYNGAVANPAGLSSALMTYWGVTAPGQPSSYPGLIGQWDASNAGSITASAGKVSQWNDLSGTGNHMVQGTGGNQWSTGAFTQNSKNVLSGTGWMEKTGLTFSSAACTIVVVGDIQAGVAWGRLASLWGGSPAVSLEWLLVSGGPQIGWRHAQTSYSADSAGQPVGMWVMRRNGTAFDVFNNGTKATGTCGAGSNTATTFTLGIDDTHAYGTNVNTRWGEVLLYNTALSDADIAAMRTNYVVPKWGTP